MKKASTECGRVGWVEASESAVIRAAVAYDARRVWDRRPARHAQPNPVCQSSRGMDPLPPTPTAAPAPGSAAVFPLRRDPGRDGTGLVLDKVHRRFPWLGLFWADGDYDAWRVKAAVAKTPRLRMEIVKRSDNMRGFVVLPRRWVVERTFSWFGRDRRLAKDFETSAEPWPP